MVGLGLGLLLLSGVGVVRGQEAKEDRGKILGDAKCFICHEDHKTSFPKSIHGGLGGEDDSVSCETCHGAGEKHVLSGGEVELIIAYGKLDATAASKRCLSCHGRSAPKGGHIDGFLESPWLAKGLSCSSCHQAHAPLVEEAPAKAAAPKTVGEASCLVCHSDYRDYTHRPHVADALGCETCHGAGRAHAESEGDTSLIRNPLKLESPDSDRSCMMCHSDKTAPEHFKPEPGKNRCADCHSIHAAPVVEEAAAAMPGAPAFHLDGVEGEAAPAPEGAGNVFRLPPLPAPTGIGARHEGIAGSGTVRFGGRWTNVIGNEDVYEKDVDLDSGFRLFDFDLNAWVANHPETKLRFTGEGTSDPVANYLLDVRREGSWSFAAKYSRIQSYYHATGDPRDWKAKRKNLAADLTVILSDEFRVTLGLDFQDREGEFRGSMLASGRTINGSEPFDESGTYGYVRLDWGNGPLLLSLTQGYRREEFQDEQEAGTFSVPTDRTVDGERETDVTGPMTTFLAEWKAARELTLDGRFVWASFDADTEYESVVTGPGGGAGSVETTTGDVDGEKDYLRAELGATWVPADDWTVYGRLEGYHTKRESEGRFQTDREDPPASPPVSTSTTPTEDSEHRRLRASGELRWQTADWLGILGGIEYVKETYEVTVDGVEDDNDSTIAGPVFGFDLAATKDLDIDFLYRFTTVSDPYTEISPKDVDNARLRIRWQASDEWRITGRARRSLLTNPKHDTSVLSWGAGIGVLWTPLEELEVDASWDYQEYDTETEVIRYIGGVPETETSEYFAQTRGGHIGFLWRVLPVFRLRGQFRNVYTTGDYETGWLDIGLGAEYDMLKEMTIGVDGRYLRYNESDFDVDDYSAYLVEFWLRMGI